MKTLKMLILSIMMMTSVSAFAQFTTRGRSNNNSADTENYNRFQVGFSTASWKFDYNKSTTPDAMLGGTVGLIHGQSLSSSIPLFLEYGANLTFLYSSTDITETEDYYYDDDDELITSKNTYMNVSVPINITYKFSLGSSNVSIAPYVGINFKYNILGKTKSSSSYYDYYYDDYYYDYYDDYDDDTEKWFDSKGRKGNRFQFGAQLGVGVYFNKFYCGYQFQGDFTELYKKTKLATNTVSFGICF